MIVKNSLNQVPNLFPWQICVWIGFMTGMTNWLLFARNPVKAQITPDGTVGTEVNTSNGTREITGGTRADTNLFHSFQNFSVETGGTAFFDNAADINNIIGRVTGKNISSIDGLIQANGNANLILINPNGINFGANARLDLGGSFLGSTADRVIFEDGTTFSANDTQAQPILTVNTPVGLQLGQNSSSIQIQGQGLARLGADLAANPGLSVTPGNTLALVGNGITFDGGVVSLQSGRIDFGSVATGEVSLLPNEAGWQLGYEAVTQFADLELLAGSSIASVNGAPIAIEADRLDISDRSLITSTNLSSDNGGNVEISAAKINITGAGFREFQQNFQLGAVRGTLTPEDLGTGIFVSTIATGKGGDLTIDAESLTLNQGAIIFSPVFNEGVGGNIDINANDINISASALQMGISGRLESSTSGTINLNTQRLQIRDGGTVINTTLGNASTGDINIIASESIELRNTPIEALVLSGIYANTFGTGKGGDIKIETTQLQIIDGLISSNTGGVLTDGTVIATGGEGGSINLQVSDSIESSGIPDNPAFTSGIGTSSYSNADAGDITISTNKLTIKEGADFATATLGTGKGGQMTIDATESIDLIGVTTPGGVNRGGLLATSGRREFPDLPATGSSGDIKVNTSNLKVRDGASIDVQSIGAGDAGSLNIDADSVTLDNRASLSASTQFGAGGDIQITADNLQLNQSLINASVLGEGRGGNIRIKARDSVEVFGSGFDSLQGLFFTQGIPEIESLANLIANIESSPITEGIVAFTTGNADAGVISIETADLQIANGGLVATTTGGNGAAGSIFFNASENLKVNSSIVSSSSLFTGQGGDIVIETKNLEALAGSQITSSTLGSGNSGDININATKSTTVAGASTSNIPSNIAVGP